MDIKPTDPAFAQVWQRVKGSPPDQHPSAPTERPWERFVTDCIRAELTRRQTCLRWGLESAARENWRRARKLATAWFFHTGVFPWPTQLPPPERCHSRCAAIRQLYRAETQAGQAYLRAAAVCPEASLRETFARCAEGCRRSCAMLWRAVEGRVMLFAPPLVQAAHTDNAAGHQQQRDKSDHSKASFPDGSTLV